MIEASYFDPGKIYKSKRGDLYEVLRLVDKVDGTQITFKSLEKIKVKKYGAFKHTFAVYVCQCQNFTRVLK